MSKARIAADKFCRKVFFLCLAWLPSLAREGCAAEQTSALRRDLGIILGEHSDS